MVLNKLEDSGEPLPPFSDIQRTTFSLDALARFFCNTWEEVVNAQKEDQFDVIVVGSGMYGAYCASKLFEFGKQLPKNFRPRILVLESGPFLISEHVQNLTRAGELFHVVNETLVEDQQKKIVEDVIYSNSGNFNKHQRCVGGKSLFWGGWAPRLTDADLDQWPNEVVEYLYGKHGYKFIEKEIGSSCPTDFINNQLNRIIKERAEEAMLSLKRNGKPNLIEVKEAPIAVAGNSPGSGLFSVNKFSSLPLLLDALRQDNDDTKCNAKERRLFLVPNVEVLKLETCGKGIVTEVVVALKDPFNPNDKSKARVERLKISDKGVVVIAGNTINSTRLALNSFPRPQHLSPNSELMGRNLMVHVRGNYFWKIYRAALEVPEKLNDELQIAALHIRGEVEVEKGKFGQYHFQFYTAPSLDDPAYPGAKRNPEEFLYRMIPSLDEFERIRYAQTTDTMKGKVVIGIRTCGETFGHKSSGIDSENKNTFSWMNVNSFGGEGDDVYGKEQLRIPKAYVNLVETENDRKVRVYQTKAAFDFIEALAQQPTGSAHETDPTKPIRFIKMKNESERESVEDGLGTTYHESGTLWMGTDYTNSVTDVNGRFHHISNAYCIDQSIFPTVGSANPVPTGLVLSRKIADSIIKRYTSSKKVTKQRERDFRFLYGNEINFKLDGWECVESDHKNFVDDIDQGEKILKVGTYKEGELGVLLYTKQKFKNFILKLDWKALHIRANSGIFLRTPINTQILNEEFYDSSIEIQIDESGYDYVNGIYGSPLHKTGAVYEVFPAQRWSAKAIGYWNSYEIRVEDEKIEVKLNDELVSQGNFTSEKHKKLSEGYIGLQSHTNIVYFRNIRIKEL